MKNLDWQCDGEAPTTGRVAKVSDEGCGYWAIIPDDFTLENVIEAFENGYDYGDYVGEIKCFAAIENDGEETESKHFTLDNSEAL